MPAPAAQPRFDRVENALATADGYRRLAALSERVTTREHMLFLARRWERRAARFEQAELPFPLAGESRRPDPNPCRALFGPGPQDQRCADCALLHANTPGRRTYHKCALRVFTRSGRSDHRLRWLACARFEPRA